MSAASACGRPADLDTVSEELFRQLSSGQTVNLSAILGGSSAAAAATAINSRVLPPPSAAMEAQQRPPPAAAPVRQPPGEDPSSSSGAQAAARSQGAGGSAAAVPSQAAAPVAAVGLQVRRARCMDPSQVILQAPNSFLCLFVLHAEWCRSVGRQQ